VEWIGEVPAYWEAQRMDAFTSIYRHPMSNEILSSREVFHYSIPSVQERGTGQLEDGDTIESNKTLISEQVLLVSKLNPRKGTIALASPQQAVTVCSGEFIPLVPRQCVPRYLEYVYRSEYVRQLLSSRVESVTRSHQRVNPIEIYKMFWTWPPLPEQHAIAAFLDRETGRIDTLIERKVRQVELLQEKRAALISHAVTRGLNRDVKMKDSRVEWIGKIPEHWTLLPMKRNWQVTDCKHKTVSFIDNGIPVASIGEVKTIDVNLVNAKMTTYEEYEELIGGGRKPKRGDIIYSRNATVGAAAFVNNDVDFCMGQDVCLISSKINNQRFLIHQLLSPVVINQLESLYVGATFKRINVDQIKNFLIVCPSPKEQEVIASYCDKISQRAEILSTKIRQSLSKLREYRTALISAAVTGKIDVRSE
jgi:type I restriction enzyme S subunit